MAAIRYSLFRVLSDLFDGNCRVKIALQHLGTKEQVGEDDVVIHAKAVEKGGLFQMSIFMALRKCIRKQRHSRTKIYMHIS